jgi:hypothetical protein
VRDIVPGRDDFVCLLPGNFLEAFFGSLTVSTTSLEMFLKILLSVILVEDHLVVDAFTFSEGRDVLLKDFRMLVVSSGFTVILDTLCRLRFSGCCL